VVFVEQYIVVVRAKRAAKWAQAVNKMGIGSDQSSVISWLVQPIN